MRNLIQAPRRLSVAGLTFVVLGAAMATAAPVTAGSSSTCDYDGGNGTVKVVITGSGGTQISRNADGRILVDGVWCDNDATVQNTDRITILAGDGNQGVDLWLREGGFRPGLTNETGNSDEIEISLNLGGGADTLSFTGNDQAADNIRFGRSSGSFVVGGVNLNAGETTGIDNDVTMVVGIENVSAVGNDGSDTISGAGGAGTGTDFILPMTLYGNNGADLIVGGTLGDHLFGGAGGDTLRGRGSNDYLETTDGVGGNDTANGGGGNDDCVTDPGDTETNC